MLDVGYGFMNRPMVPQVSARELEIVSQLGVLST